MTPKTTIAAVAAAGVLAFGAGTALSRDDAPNAKGGQQTAGHGHGHGMGQGQGMGQGHGQGKGQGQGQGHGKGQGQGGQGRGGQGGGGGQGSATKLTLSSAAKRELLYMREEEKVAADVYATLAKQYPSAPFGQITNSETKHASAIQRQLDRAGIADPTVGNAVGEFENDELQKMYNALVARGAASLTEALSVAALIEETDIADLRTSIKTTKDTQLRRVYTNLERASGQHLRVFAGELKAAGVTYRPTVLSQASYDKILRSSMR